MYIAAVQRAIASRVRCLFFYGISKLLLFSDYLEGHPNLSEQSCKMNDLRRGFSAPNLRSGTL